LFADRESWEKHVREEARSMLKPLRISVGARHGMR